MIFYEAPHKLVSTLKDMLEYFGDRRISLCRELTKVYEEVIRCTLSEAIDYYETKSPKGEYVLVVEGAKPDEKPEGEINAVIGSHTLEEAAGMARKLIEEGMKTIDACKKTASETGYRKSEIYQIITANSGK